MIKIKLTYAATKGLFLLSAFSFLLSSCSQDEVFEQDSLKDTPLTIASAGVAELTTRAIIEGQLIGRMEEPIVMSVWVEGSAETVRQKLNNRHCWSAYFLLSPQLFPVPYLLMKR